MPNALFNLGISRIFVYGYILLVRKDSQITGKLYLALSKKVKAICKLT